MSNYHCWSNLERILCVALAYACFAVTGYGLPAFAAEVNTGMAVQQVTAPAVSKAPSIGGTANSSELADTIRTAKTGDTDSPDAPLQPATGTVSPSNSAIAAGQNPLVNSADNSTNNAIDGLEPNFRSQPQLQIESLINATPIIADDDEDVYDLILRLQRKNEVLDPAFIGLQKGLKYYIPLNALLRGIKIPVDIDFETGRAVGFFVSNDLPFIIDFKANTYKFTDETGTFESGDVIIKDRDLGLGEVYIELETLNKILPLALEINFSELSIEIGTRRKLPADLELERIRRQQRLIEKRAAEGEIDPNLDIPDTYNGYRLLGPQIIRLTDTLFWSQEESEVTNNFVVSGRGDMLGASADYTLNVQNGGQNGNLFNLNDLRFRLTREDFGGGTLPYGLKKVQVGDISNRSSRLIENVVTGRGVYVTNDPRRRPSSFDEVVIEGIASPDWEVELYRGFELLDYGAVDSGGIYRFENVPLNYGQNRFRIVLYGPQGQVEERFEAYDIDRNMLAPGESTFEASVIDNRKRLFDVDDRNKTASDEGLVKNLRINRGILPWASGFMTATDTIVRDEHYRYLSLGTNLSLGRANGQVELYKQLGGGAAIDTRLGTRFAGVNLNIRNSLYRDFESRDAGVSDDRKKRFESDVRASRSFETSFGGFALGLGGRHTLSEDGFDTSNITTNQSALIGNKQVTNATTTQLINGEHTATSGVLSNNLPIAYNWDLRTNFDYDVHPETEADRARFELRYSDYDKFTGELRYYQGIKDSNDTLVGAGATYDFGTFLGGADVDWQKNAGLSVLLRADTTFGPEGPDREYLLTTDYKGYTTGLQARLFHDVNMDGIFNDPPDIAIKGTKITFNGRSSKRSDEQGIIDIRGAGPEGRILIKVDRDSLPDPFLAMVTDGYTTTLRQGTKPFIDIPLILTGSIDGTVRLPDGSAASGLIIQLINQSGEVVQDAPTLFDGFYVFEFVKPGTYTVRVSPSHKVFVQPKTVTVSSSDLFAYGVDFTLSASAEAEQSEEASVANEADGARGRVAHTNHALATGGTKQAAPTSSDGGFQATVRSVRLGEYPYKTRLVLDLSDPADYQISSLNGGDIINIDMPSTAWDAQNFKNLSNHKIFESIEPLALNGGTGTRLRLTGRTPIEVFYNDDLPPAAGKPNRIYFDFIKK